MFSEQWVEGHWQGPKAKKVTPNTQITVKEDQTDLCCHLMLSEEGVYIKKEKSFRNRVIEE